jgi:hypothetical protein
MRLIRLPATLAAMRSHKKTTALALAGALALGSVAYGLGSQAGDGSAAARGDGEEARAGQPGLGPDFSSLADELGVDADELRDALRDFHDEKGTDRRAAFATALADALGKSRADVEAALEKRLDAERAKHAKRLADALGLEADDVAAALEKVMEAERADGAHGPEDFIERLADELGVSADAVEEAFREAAPRRFERGPRHRGPGLSGLASALDVTPAELRKALLSLRRTQADERADQRAELVKFLAERFDLEQSKVDEALPEFGPGPDGRRGGPGHHGPGFGGPGFGGPGFGGPPPGP